MSDITRVQECAEAINGALYSLEFEFLGETGEHGVSFQSAWWSRGDNPQHKIRVEVAKAKAVESVLVHVEFRNWSLGRHLKGKITMNIECDAEHSKAKVEQGAKMAVMRILEIYKECLEGKGVAGREYAEKYLNPNRGVEEKPVMADAADFSAE